MPRIVIVEPTGSASARLQNAVSQVPEASISQFGTYPEALEALGTDPAVVVVGPSQSGNGALDQISAQRAGMHQLLLVAESPDTELMRRAMRVGARDVIPFGATDAEIAEAVARALAESTVAESTAVAEGPRGRVVTVFATKGGVGKSVLSTNIAASLATQYGKRTALVDLDLQFGDVGIMLGLPPERTIYDAVQAYERLDPALLGGVMTRHSSGLDVLLAPAQPEDAESVTSNRIAGIIEMLRGMYEFVVVDTAPIFSDITLTTLDNSDVVYIVTMMDVASIKNTRISLQKLRQLGYDPTMMRLVLNRADSKVLLNAGEVEKSIGGVTGRVPSDLLVPRSVNKGVPIVLDAPRSKVARSISALASNAVA